MKSELRRSGVSVNSQPRVPIPGLVIRILGKCPTPTTRTGYLTQKKAPISQGLFCTAISVFWIKMFGRTILSRRLLPGKAFSEKKRARQINSTGLADRMEKNKQRNSGQRAGARSSMELTPRSIWFSREGVHTKLPFPLRESRTELRVSNIP